MSGHPAVDRHRIEQLTRAGWSAQRIAETLHCHPRTVTRIRGILGIARPPSRHFTADEIARIEVLLDDGCSLTEIERTIGRSPGTLAKKFPGRGWSHQELSEFGGFCSRMARASR